MSGEDANLEYTEKVTDLVLENLKDQLEKDQVDRKLLDKLGWTREDMERFVRRWEQMKRGARQANPRQRDAREELNDALRSLGLRKDRIFRKSRPLDDRIRRLHESHRSKPPLGISGALKGVQPWASRRLRSSVASTPHVLYRTPLLSPVSSQTGAPPFH